MAESSSAEGLLKLRNEIIQLLAGKGCTVREANYILTQASRAISATASVQSIQDANYEF